MYAVQCNAIHPEKIDLAGISRRKHKISPGDALTAKFCVNIAFFGCRTHFSHIAASPYAK